MKDKYRIPALLAPLLLLTAVALSCTKEPGLQGGEDTRQDGEEIRYGAGTIVGRVLVAPSVPAPSATPLSGVVVSDGYVVDTTDALGCFALPSRKEHGYVFLSIPDVYDVPTDGVIPAFFAPVGKYPTDTVIFTLSPDPFEEHTFYVLGDMHLANKRRDLQQFTAFAADLNAARNPGDFAVTLGDMSWDAFWDGYDLEDYLSRVNRDFSGMQIFHTIGNHDHDLSKDGDWATADAFKRIIGPTYYSFNRGGVHFVVLDDIVCTNSGGNRSSYNSVDSNQLSWLKKDLSYVPYATPVAVFLHAPLYNNAGSLSLRNAMDLINCFRGYSDITFFSGHTHCVYNVDMTTRQGYVPVYENCIGAVCGAWWYTCYDFPTENVHLGPDGAPGGYKVVKLKDGRLSWQFKATGRPESYQFRTYDRNAICLDASCVPSATDAAKKAFLNSVGDYVNASSDNIVYINVWDWDPSWKIEVKENGQTLQTRRLSSVKDPMYLFSMEAYAFNKGFTAEYTAGVLTASYPASTTNHVFSVKASSPSSTLDITVTDRFGRKYTETMLRPKELKLQY